MVNCWNLLEALSHNVAGDSRRDGSKIRVGRSTGYDVDLVYGQSAAEYLGRGFQVWGPSSQVSEIKVQRPEGNLVGDQGQGLRSTTQTLMSDDMVCSAEKSAEGLLTRKTRNTRQNVPRPKGDIFKIRGAFVAPPGKLLVNADYDQLEMKLLADFADEQSMIDAINTGKDMHCTTAALMYEVPYEAVADAKHKSDGPKGTKLTPTDKQLLSYRQNSKTIGFGLMYGEGPNKLAGQLGITYKEAEQLIDRFFKPFPGIKAFIEDVHNYVTAHGLVRTLSGRPRHLKNGVAARGENDDMYFRALRQAVNAIIQGCLDEEELVQTVEGSVALKDLDPAHHKILTYSGATQNYVVHETGKKVVYRIETGMGSSRATKDHRFMTYSGGDLGVTPLSKLDVGDWVVGATQAPLLQKRLPAEMADWAELIGILCGDGSYTRDRDFHICVAEKSGGYTDYVKALLDRVWPGVHAPARKNRSSRGESYVVDVTNKPFRLKLAELGLVPASKDKKSVPAWVLSCGDQRVQLSALRGLYDTDGGISASRYPTFTNKSEKLAQAFHALCANVGIPSSVRKYGDVYRTVVDPLHAEQFTALVRPAHRHKHSPAQIPKRRLPPALVRDVAELVLGSSEWSAAVDMRRELVRKTSTATWNRREHVYQKKANFTRSEQSHIYHMRKHGGTVQGCLRMLGKLADSPEKRNLLDLVALPWAKIRKIERVGRVPTRDIEIFSNDHCYISGGLVMHNSAADIVRKAMILCEFDPVLNELGCEQLLQVHDELMFECPEENVAKAMERVQELMESPYKQDLRVKLTAGPKAGFTWMDAK